MNLEFQIKVQTKEDVTAIQIGRYLHWLEDIMHGYFLAPPTFLIGGTSEINAVGLANTIIDQYNGEIKPYCYKQAEPGNA